MKKAFITLTGIAFAWTSAVQGAAAAEALTWQDILRETQEKSPALRQAGETVKNARFSCAGTRAGFLPRVSASAGLNRSRSAAAEADADYSYGISGSVPLFTGGRMTAELKTQEAGIRSAEARYRAARADTVFAVRRNFLDLLAAQETLSLARDIARRRGENLELVQLKYEAGREDMGSLLRVEADKLQAEYDVQRAGREVATTSAALLMSMGRTPAEAAAGVIVDGDFKVSPPPENPSFADLARETPRYAAALEQKEQSTYRARAARAVFSPEVSATGSLSRGGAVWEDGASRWSVGLGLSYPLFSGGRNTANVQMAETDRVSAEEALRETEQTLLASVTGAWNGYADAVENVRVTEKYLEASRAQSRIAAEKYINGLISYQDWYVIENDFIRAQRSLVEAKRSAALSAAQWNNIIGAGAEE